MAGLRGNQNGTVRERVIGNTVDNEMETVFTVPMTTYTYFTKQTTGTVHLALPPLDTEQFTLCGFATHTMDEGDETASGFLTTCGRCRSIIDPVTAVESFLSGKGK